MRQKRILSLTVEGNRCIIHQLKWSKTQPAQIVVALPICWKYMYYQTDLLVSSRFYMPKSSKWESSSDELYVLSSPLWPLPLISVWFYGVEIPGVVRLLLIDPIFQPVVALTDTVLFAFFVSGPTCLPPLTSDKGCHGAQNQGFCRWPRFALIFPLNMRPCGNRGCIRTSGCSGRIPTNPTTCSPCIVYRFVFPRSRQVHCLIQPLCSPCRNIKQPLLSFHPVILITIKNGQIPRIYVYS